MLPPVIQERVHGHSTHAGGSTLPPSSSYWSVADLRRFLRASTQEADEQANASSYLATRNICLPPSVKHLGLKPRSSYLHMEGGDRRFGMDKLLTSRQNYGMADLGLLGILLPLSGLAPIQLLPRHWSGCIAIRRPISWLYSFFVFASLVWRLAWAFLQQFEFGWVERAGWVCLLGVPVLLFPVGVHSFVVKQSAQQAIRSLYRQCRNVFLEEVDAGEERSPAAVHELCGEEGIELKEIEGELDANIQHTSTSDEKTRQKRQRELKRRPSYVGSLHKQKAYVSRVIYLHCVILFVMTSLPWWFFNSQRVLDFIAGNLPQSFSTSTDKAVASIDPRAYSLLVMFSDMMAFFVPNMIVVHLSVMYHIQFRSAQQLVKYLKIVWVFEKPLEVIDWVEQKHSLLMEYSTAKIVHVVLPLVTAYTGIYISLFLKHGGDIASVSVFIVPTLFYLQFALVWIIYWKFVRHAKGVQGLIQLAKDGQFGQQSTRTLLLSPHSSIDEGGGDEEKAPQQGTNGSGEISITARSAVSLVAAGHSLTSNETQKEQRRNSTSLPVPTVELLASPEYLNVAGKAFLGNEDKALEDVGWGTAPWKLYFTLIMHCVILMAFVVAFLSLRMYLQFPLCVDVQNDPIKHRQERVPTTCDSKWNWIRDIESTLLGYTTIPLAPGLAAYLLFSGDTRSKAHVRHAILLLCACTFAGVLSIKRYELEFVWEQYVALASYFLTTLVCSVQVSRTLNDWSFFRTFVPLTLFFGIVRLVQGLVIIPEYSRGIDGKVSRILIVLAIHPPLMLVVRAVANNVANRMSSIRGISNVVVLLVIPQAMLAIVGRLYLVNINDLSTQIMAAFLLTIVEIASRLTAPFRSYIRWYAILGDADSAFEHSETFRVSPVYRHARYLDMMAELLAIMTAPVFSVVFKMHQGIETPAVPLILTSVAVQVAVEFIGDIVAVVLEEVYHDRKIISLWTHHQKNLDYLKTFVPFLAILSCISFGDYIVITASALKV